MKIKLKQQKAKNTSYVKCQGVLQTIFCRRNLELVNFVGENLKIEIIINKKRLNHTNMI